MCFNAREELIVRKRERERKWSERKRSKRAKGCGS